MNSTSVIIVVTDTPPVIVTDEGESVDPILQYAAIVIWITVFFCIPLIIIGLQFLRMALEFQIGADDIELQFTTEELNRVEEIVSTANN